MDFGAGTYALGFTAGVLSILSPCVLPLVPILIATAGSAHRLGALALATGLMISFTVVGLFVATIGFAIGLDAEWFRASAAILLVVFGVVLLSSAAQRRFAASLGSVSNLGESLFARVHLSGLPAQFVAGTLLGVVWAPCVGPTLGAASTLAAQGKSLPQVTAVMIMFGLGAAMPLAVLGAVSRRGMSKLRSSLLAAGTLGKNVLGVVFLVLGLLILTHTDKRVEAFFVKQSPAWLIDMTTRY